MADMVKVRVVRPYHDSTTGTDHYEIGSAVRYSQRRAEELAEKGLVEIEETEESDHEE